MTDQNRRSTDTLESRIAILEVENNHILRLIETHAKAIEEIMRHDNETLQSFAVINQKIAGLIEKVDVSLNGVKESLSAEINKLYSIAKAICYCVSGGASLIVIVVGGFWNYSHDMDAKYMTRMEHIRTISDEEKKMILEHRRQSE